MSKIKSETLRALSHKYSMFNVQQTHDDDDGGGGDTHSSLYVRSAHSASSGAANECALGGGLDMSIGMYSTTTPRVFIYIQLSLQQRPRIVRQGMDRECVCVRCRPGRGVRSALLYMSKHHHLGRGMGGS